MPEHAPYYRVRAYVNDVLDGYRHRDRGTRIVSWCLALLIFLNIGVFVIETATPISAGYKYLFNAILYLSIGIFSVEYLLRIWSCVNHQSGRYAHPIRGRLRYIISPLAALDLAAIFPFFIGVSSLDLRFLRVFRLLWLLRITHRFPAMSTLGRVLRRERRTLGAVFTVMLALLFTASCLIYIFEHKEQPTEFASVFHAMWWGVSTLTTVGYGDVIPISTMGRILGVMVMLLGIGTFALPAGILASAFYEERKRQDFIVTWKLVAQVPLFSQLDAMEIASVATLLHPREALPGEVLFYKGEEGESMYFIVSGNVKIELSSNPVHRGQGEFFGEISVTLPFRRTATVVATTRCQLLELYAKDVHRLFEANPQLKAKVLAEAKRRVSETPEETLRDTVTSSN